MDKEKVVKKVEKVLEDRLEISAVYLFGSRAKGSHREGSDYDIAVVSEDFKDMSFGERQSLIRPLIREALGDVPLDAVCYTPEEFEQGKDAFLPSVIDEEGVPA